VTHKGWLPIEVFLVHHHLFGYNLTLVSPTTDNSRVPNSVRLPKVTPQKGAQDQPARVRGCAVHQLTRAGRFGTRHKGMRGWPWCQRERSRRGSLPRGEASSLRGLSPALIPEEAIEFDQQWRAVMATATETLDLTEVLAVLESWRRIAWMTSTMDLTRTGGCTSRRGPPHRPRHPGRRGIGPDEGSAGPVAGVHRHHRRRDPNKQLDALPAQALAPFADLRTTLEVAPWNGAPLNRFKPDSPMRTLPIWPAQ
jgi:hypothetical protein